MAYPAGDPGVQVAFPAALFGGLAGHQRNRLRGPLLDGRIVSAILQPGFYHVPARALWGGGLHAVARDQGLQTTTAERRSPIVRGCVMSDSFYAGDPAHQ